MTVQKWRALAGVEGETRANSEDVRLQLLVAAIIHPKTGESVVMSSMARLRSWGGKAGLSATALAQASPETLEQILEGVHWHKAKAGRISAAATALVQRFRGRVPTHREELLSVPGIGPTGAGLLAYVFCALNADAGAACEG
jgi:endonuclease-3